MDDIFTASQKGNTKRIRELLIEGVSVNAHDSCMKLTPLHYAACAGDVETCKLLLDYHADVDARDIVKSTPLLYAVKNGHIEAAATLLAWGASAQARNEIGASPLHEAAFTGNYETLRLLLKMGASVSATDNNGNEPLYYAAVKNRIQCCKILLANGAKVNAKNKFGRTALDGAREGNHTEACLLLECALSNTKADSPIPNESAPRVKPVGTNVITMLATHLNQHCVCAKCNITLQERVHWWREPRPGVVKTGDGKGLFLWCEHCKAAICGGCAVDLGMSIGCPFCNSELEEYGEKRMRDLVFDEIRSFNIPEACNMASIVSSIYPDNAFIIFMEGLLAYALRKDELALMKFRTCAQKNSLLAEAQYYVGQLLTESAIDHYRKAFTGPLTAEKALRWAGAYNEAVLAFAYAEQVSNALQLASVRDFTFSYKLLLGIIDFPQIASLPSNAALVEDIPLSLAQWMALIGLQYDRQQISRPEALVDLVSFMARKPAIVFLIDGGNLRAPVSTIMSRRREVNLIEVGPRMTDEMLKNHLTSAKPGSVLLTNPRRIGFGGYFPWTPNGPADMEIVIVNAQNLLSAEFFGLLARIKTEAEKSSALRITLVDYR
jgi:hypothetical protein